MEQDKELKAMGEIISALVNLDTEGQSRVINYVLVRLGIRSSDGQLKQIGISTPNFKELPGVKILSDSPVLDIWSLRQQKQPKSAIQMAVLVAYYLKEFAPHSERKDAVDTSDIEKYFTQAKFELPAGKNGARDTLNNAKKSGYMEITGPGNYKLNAVGYNLAAYRLNESSQVIERKKNHKSKKNQKGKKNPSKK